MVGFQLKLRELFMIVDKNFENLLSCPQVKRVMLSNWNFFRHSSTIKGVPFWSIASRITVLQTKVQVSDFWREIFYRLLSAINRMLILLSILFYFWYNIDSKTFMHSSEVNIFIGAYRQLITTLILLSILLIFDIL